MIEPTTSWTENESDAYRALARYAVPEREHQIEIMVALVGAAAASGPVLDLCCGEGLWTEALLRAQPETMVYAFDGSDSMLEATRATTGAPDRLTTRRIDLAERGWRRFEPPLRAVVSSLAIHHLDHDHKRELFADLYDALAPGGVFVLGDVVDPATGVGSRIAADLWDQEVRRRALAQDGTLDGYELFQQADWNHFRHLEPDPIDKPARLTTQFDWLRSAGFVDVDLHWMIAGQMILSAWKR